MLEDCKELGFTLFQGYYFAKPELKRSKKINPSQMAKVRLISMLNDPDFKVDEVSKIVQSDAALSLKLFRYLNSSIVVMQEVITRFFSTFQNGYNWQNQP